MSETLTIEKLVYGGDGLARLDGQVVLTPFVLPGERVTVNTSRAKTGLLRGSLPDIVDPSSERVTPRCEYFGTCGGCQYQHAAYEFQVVQKVAILRETLQRLGGLTYEDEIPTLTGEPWSYRNRVQLHFAGRQGGFHKSGSRDLCPVDHCPISAPLLVEAIAKIQQAAKRPEWPGFLQSLELFTNGNDLQLNVLQSTRPVAARFFEWCKTFLPSLVPGPVDYQAAAFRFRISGGSFFQVNRFLIDTLVEEALQDAEGAYAVDLYAGVGLFTLPLANRFRQVDAVERGVSAIRDLEHNLGQSKNVVTANRASAENYLAALGDTPELLLVDPPRAGLGPETTAAILRLLPPRLTIVSCDPATLARDARTLLNKYTVRRMALVDLFPQTYHFETVMHLEKKASEDSL